MGRASTSSSRSRATNADGFNADTVRVVTENARTLKFDQHGFERDG